MPSVFSLNAANRQDEAALLSGLTYLNVHTAAFRGGVIRGQLFSGGNVSLATARRQAQQGDRHRECHRRQRGR